MQAVIDVVQLVSVITEQTTKSFFNERETHDRHNRGKLDIMNIQMELVCNTSLIFDGGTNALVADNWISNMEHRFEYLEVSNPYLMGKVAPIIFHKEAVAWWKGQR